MKSDWQAQKKQMSASFEKQFVDAVISTAEKVVGASLDAKAHAKLIDEELKMVLKSI